VGGISTQAPLGGGERELKQSESLPNIVRKISPYMFHQPKFMKPNGKKYIIPTGI
jgi:hypothetical protein